MTPSCFRSRTASSNNAHCACNTPTPCVTACMTYDVLAVRCVLHVPVVHIELLVVHTELPVVHPELRTTTKLHVVHSKLHSHLSSQQYTPSYQKRLTTSSSHQTTYWQFTTNYRSSHRTTNEPHTGECPLLHSHRHVNVLIATHMTLMSRLWACAPFKKPPKQVARAYLPVAPPVFLACSPARPGELPVVRFRRHGLPGVRWDVVCDELQDELHS